MLLKVLGMAGVLCLSALPFAPQQDVTFRMLNLERRCDQLQQRVDSLERQIQNQAIAGVVDPNRELILDMQRQQLSFQQQMLAAQQIQLELKKALDQQAVRLQELEKRGNEKPVVPVVKATPTPTPTPRRP